MISVIKKNNALYICTCMCVCLCHMYMSMSMYNIKGLLEIQLDDGASLVIQAEEANVLE